MHSKKHGYCLHDISEVRVKKHFILETNTIAEKDDILETIYKYGFKEFQVISDLRQHWLANDHCSTLVIPQPYPNLLLSTRGSTYRYRTHVTSCKPDNFHALSKVYTNTVSQVNMKNPHAINFMLPVYLMGLNWLDPETRRLTISGIAKYLRTQDRLLCVVFEDSKLSITPFLILLLALAAKSGKSVRKLYLWRAFKFEDIPFLGPLPDAKYNDNLRPKPPTVHLNGKKFLEELKKTREKNQTTNKQDAPQAEIVEHEVITDVVNDILHQASTSTTSIPGEENLNNWFQNLILQAVKIKNSNSSLTSSNNSESINEWSRNLLLNLVNFDSIDQAPEKSEEPRIGSKISVKNTPDLEMTSRNSKGTILMDQSTQSVQSPKELFFPEYDDYVSYNKRTHGSQTVHLTDEEISDLLACIYNTCSIGIEETIRINKINACQVYLNFYKYSNISKHVLREIYIIALSGLRTLTTLSINYSYLADDTGKTLMSIGSICTGFLQYIELLCCPEDLPCQQSCREEPRARHSIPNITWLKVLQYCPKLKVKLVLVSISTYDEVKMFLSKSMPVISFDLDSGVQLYEDKYKQYNYCSIFKMLAVYFAEILENITLVLWRHNSYLDTTYLKFLREMKTLQSFELFTHLKNINTIEKMCDIILQPKCSIMNLKVCLQEDQCQTKILRNKLADITEKYNQRFEEKGAILELYTYKI